MNRTENFIFSDEFCPFLLKVLGFYFFWVSWDVVWVDTEFFADDLGGVGGVGGCLY